MPFRDHVSSLRTTRHLGEEPAEAGGILIMLSPVADCRSISSSFARANVRTAVSAVLPSFASLPVAAR